MDQGTRTEAATPGRPARDRAALQLPVRYVHDPSSDRWSFTIEIPPIRGEACGCREVAERSAIAALRRHLAGRPGPHTDTEHIGHLALTVDPAPDEVPCAAADAPPVATVHRGMGFHPFATTPSVCRVAAEGAASPATARPVKAAAVTPVHRARIGFHPHALRSPGAVEDPEVGGDALALAGRRVHWRMRNPHATAQVAILDIATSERIDGCTGPRRDGRCARVEAGLAVPCAGRRIRGDLCVASRHFCFDVAPASTRCPLGWLVESLAAAIL